MEEIKILSLESISGTLWNTQNSKAWPTAGKVDKNLNLLSRKVSNSLAGRGRPSNLQCLTISKSSSCPSIVDSIESKRKRNPEDQLLVKECEQSPRALKKSNKSASPNNAEQVRTEVMDKILSEIGALRADQEKKHADVTARLEQNFNRDQAAFADIQCSLKSLKKELQGTKTDLSERVKALELNTVKISQVNELKMMVSTGITESNPVVDGAYKEKIEYFVNKFDYLEKENKETKISIAGLIFSTNNHIAEVKHFLSSKFNVDCANIIVKEYHNRVFVDLLNTSQKASILKEKNNKLLGTEIFIEPDRTSRERNIDWQIRQFIKQQVKEGKKTSRKGNKVLVDDLTYVWNYSKNSLMPLATN